MELLTDDGILLYLLKNEDIIKICFNVPVDVSLSKFLINLSNKAFKNQGEKKVGTYKIFSLYATKKKYCSLCNNKLTMKKKLNMTLYDDIMGTQSIVVLTKYCKKCKLTVFLKIMRTELEFMIRIGDNTEYLCRPSVQLSAMTF